MARSGKSSGKKKHNAPKTESSELRQFNLYKHKVSWTRILLTRLLVIAVLITVIVLGSIGQVYRIGTTMIFGINVDPDLQLALIGLVNKIMDLLVTTCLENFAGVLLTLSMTCTIARVPSSHGMHLFDLQLAKELTTPWHAITSFAKRTQVLGWHWKSVTRFLLCLIISVCVLLQALAINTLGIPKERWYPSAGAASIAVAHPIARFQGHGLDWGNFWDSAWSMVGDGAASWHVSDGLIASSTISILRTYKTQMLNAPRGWREFDAEDNLVALDTRYNATSSRGLALQSSVVHDIFKLMQQTNDQAARASVGWTGNLTLEVPSAIVTCGQYRELSGTGSVIVDPIPDDDDSRASFEMSITPLTAQQTQTNGAFSGANCNVSFERVQFPVQFWISNGADSVSISVNRYDTVYNTSVIALSDDGIDREIARRLSVQVQATTARLESLVNNATAAQLYTDVARNIGINRTDFKSDAEALAPVIALLTTQLLAVARWNITYPDDARMTSSPIRWQLFGSGPRLGWEWSASIILAVLLLAMLCGITVSCVYPVKPGPWLEPAGMLVAANRSPPMTKLQQSMTMDEKKTDQLLFYVKQAQPTGDTAILDDSLKPEARLQKGKIYYWPTQ